MPRLVPTFKAVCVSSFRGLQPVNDDTSKEEEEEEKGLKKDVYVVKLPTEEQNTQTEKEEVKQDEYSGSEIELGDCEYESDYAAEEWRRQFMYERYQDQMEEMRNEIERRNELKVQQEHQKEFMKEIARKYEQKVQTYEDRDLEDMVRQCSPDETRKQIERRNALERKKLVRDGRRRNKNDSVFVMGSTNDEYDLEKHLQIIEEGEGQHDHDKPKKKKKQKKNKKSENSKAPSESALHEPATNPGVNESIESKDISNKPKVKVVHDETEKDFTNTILTQKIELLQIAQIHSKALMESSSKELVQLISKTEDEEEKSLDIENKITNTNLQIEKIQKRLRSMKKDKEELVKRHQKSEDIQNSMKANRKKLEELTENKLIESKNEISKLKDEILHLQTNTSRPPVKPEETPSNPNQSLINYISQKILAKEQEVECPVCMELASAPIFMCQEQHLVCSSCRPRLRECPECREVYRGKPRRHR